MKVSNLAEGGRLVDWPVQGIPHSDWNSLQQASDGQGSQAVLRLGFEGFYGIYFVIFCDKY